MTRRITCCVVFVTLIWGASAEKEEKIRDIIKSNMTRNDFSNLLKSLIKLNEQRVSVLQKLHKLEDYGVLNAVLRTGDNKMSHGNLSNLFLVVLSKNQTDPSQRTMGSQVVDSVPSLDIGSNKIKTPELRSNTHTKQERVLEPIGENNKTLKGKKLELTIRDNPTVFRSKNRYDIDDGNHIFTTLTRPHKYMHIELIGTKYHKPGQDTTEGEFSSNLTKNHITSLQSVNQSIQFVNRVNRGNRHLIEVQDRFEIVSIEGRSPKASQTFFDYDDNTNTYPPIAKDNGQSSPEIETIENVRNTKLIKIKDKLPKEHQGSKYPSVDKDKSDENDYSSKFTPLSREKSIETYHNSQYAKPNTDITNEHDYDDEKAKTNKDKKKNYKNGNKHSKINKDISVENKEKINENDHSNKYYKINRDVSHENDHESSKYHNFNRDTNKFDHDNKYSKINRDIYIESDHKFPPLSISNENVDGNKFSTIPKDLYFMEDHGNKNHTDLRGKSNEDKLTIVKDLSYEENHSNMKPKKDNDFDREEYNNYDKMSMEFAGGGDGSTGNAHSNIGRDRLLIHDKRLKLNRNGFEQLERSPESRKNFQKCINKKALKLCSKSCISAYKNVCRKLKCTSRSKRALKNECKRSCKKMFSSSSSKYSNEDADYRL